MDDRRALFEQRRWGHCRVLADALAEASKLGLSHALLAEQQDIDHLADWQAWCDRVARRAASRRMNMPETPRRSGRLRIACRMDAVVPCWVCCQRWSGGCRAGRWPQPPQRDRRFSSLPVGPLLPASGWTHAPVAGLAPNQADIVSDRQRNVLQDQSASSGS
ncbi:MAG: hypothetical protein R3E68_13625 [Burkholderiaceae bacterium]